MIENFSFFWRLSSLLSGSKFYPFWACISLSHMPPFVFGGFILTIGYSVQWNGLKALATLRFSSINLLMLLAVIGAYYLKEYPEAAVVVVLFVLGERLEDIGIESSKTALDDLLSKAPKTAFVKSLNASTPVESIRVGTIIQIKPGDLIPIDGKIVSGETAVDEAAITGEPIPKSRGVGDTVYARTLNKNGFIEIETTKLSTDTTLAKIVSLTLEASANKAETQKFIQKFAKYYTPTTIALALLLFVIPVFLLGQNKNIVL